MKIEVFGAKEAAEAMAKLGDDLPAALAAGLNRTMSAVEQAQLNAMETHLDRPTPFTLNALRIFKANPRHLDATLFVLPDQAKYLRFSIEGGELDSTIAPIIGRAKLNQHGNIPGKRTRGLAAAAQGRSSKRGRFIGRPGAGRLPLGLYERIGQKYVNAIALRLENQERKKRLPYYETAEKVAADRLRRDILAAIDAAASGR